MPCERRMGHRAKESHCSILATGLQTKGSCCDRFADRRSNVFRNCKRHRYVRSQGVMTMGRLADKNILITGGNSGIGLATAQEFDREGARVAICGLNERTLQATKERLGARSLALRGDVRDLSHLDTMFATIRGGFRHLVGI